MNRATGAVSGGGGLTVTEWMTGLLEVPRESTTTSFAANEPLEVKTWVTVALDVVVVWPSPKSH